MSSVGPGGQVTAALDRSANIVAAALDSIVTIDEEGRVVEFNPASELLFGWTRGEALGRELDKVRGLRGGADDYLTKPFHNGELVARIDGLLRRSGGAAWSGSDLGHGEVVLSPSRHAVTVAGEDVPVTPLEFGLLSMFLRHEGQVLTPTQLLATVWEDHSGFGQERVKFAVLRLRRKVGWDDPATSPLKAVRGVGYRLDPPA